MSENGYNPFAVAEKSIHADWWPDGMNVVVKELTYADEQRLATAGMRKDMPIPQTDSERRNMKPTIKDMDMENLRLETMLACIVRWDFKVPLTIASLKQLRQKDGDFIMEAIDALNPSVDEEFQNPSGNGDTESEG